MEMYYVNYSSINIAANYTPGNKMISKNWLAMEARSSALWPLWK